MEKIRQYLFDVQLTWLQDTKGILSSYGADGTLNIATPHVFGGEMANEWSAEHMFLGAVTGCYLSTFLCYADKKKLSISNFECETVGEVQLTDGKLKFTAINVYPVIKIKKEADKGITKEVLELTKINCLVSNALKVNVYYHSLVTFEDPQAVQSLL